ncbi:MAG: hypothetical protein EZS28_052423 [Streblomastix strix]|uniref:Uncharacterized protein n=1 Tax=Streblomastix strix TaxID=222440 RepID=A0A5J4S9U6_9EUKA|nr:MAG: hypothetical protein EZS28_052423 [Streblomastix strix]
MAILLRDLFIPFVTKAITSFDCNSEATVNEAGQEITQSYWTADKSLGCFKSIFQIVSFIIVFILLLGVVGVLVPGVIILMLIIQNPYYSFWSNYLATIPWIILASMRLSFEIGYSMEEATDAISPKLSSWNKLVTQKSQTSSG